jgi:hypothetical protein
MRHFGRGFTYSTEPLSGSSSDPLVNFLFESKHGHCELYAGAVAALLRVAGARTRVASGYYGGKWNSLGGYLVFTQEDAHAWVEVYDEISESWRWIDATPEDLRVRRKDSVLTFLRDWYDAVDAFWFDNVIDFDESKRKRFVERFTQPAEELLGLGDSADGPSTVRAAARPYVALIAAGVPVLIGVALVLRRRRARDPAMLGSRLRRALGANDEEQNKTLGMLVARTDPKIRVTAAECVATYERWRFGPPELAPELATVLSSIETLERARS